MQLSQAFLRHSSSGVADKRRTFTVPSLILVLTLGISTFAMSSNTNAQASKELKNNELAPIAQFINAQTLFVAQFDIDNLDVDRLGETVEDVFRQTTIKAGFSSESAEACSAEFHKTVDALKNDFETALKGLKDQYGVTKIYYVIQSAKGEGACFIIPAQSMTEAQTNSIRDVAKNLDLNCALYKKSFVIASHIPLREIGAYYRDFQPGVNEKMDAFFKANPKKLAAFYCGRLKIRPLASDLLPPEPTPDLAENDSIQSEQLDSIASQNTASKGESRSSAFLQGGVFGKETRKRKVYDPFEDSPRCVKNAVELFDSSFVEAFGCIDASNLEATMALKFSSSANAGKFKQEWANINDIFILKEFEALQSVIEVLSANPNLRENGEISIGLPILGQAAIETINDYRLVPLMREIINGEARTRLPLQNDSLLTFAVSVPDEINKLGPNTIVFAYFFQSAFSDRKKEKREEVYEKGLQIGKGLLEPYIQPN